MKENKLKIMMIGIKDFLASDMTMPVWLNWTMSFLAGGGFMLWVYHFIGKIFGLTFYIGKAPQD